MHATVMFSSAVPNAFSKLTLSVQQAGNARYTTRWFCWEPPRAPHAALAWTHQVHHMQVLPGVLLQPALPG